MISVQCIRTGDIGVDQYVTHNIAPLQEAFDIEARDLIDNVRRTTYNIDFDTDFDQVLNEILRELGIERFNIPVPTDNVPVPTDNVPVI
jgi:hypothetical protein